MKPDAVIVARRENVYGAPDVSGIDLGHRLHAVSQLTAWPKKPLKLFGAETPSTSSPKIALRVGKNYVVLRRLRSKACKARDLPAKRGQKTSRCSKICRTRWKGVAAVQTGRLSGCRENDAETITGVEYRSIDKRGIRIRQRTAKERYLKADSILVFQVSGFRPELVRPAERPGPEVYSIGACRDPDHAHGRRGGRGRRPS